MGNSDREKRRRRINTVTFPLLRCSGLFLVGLLASLQKLMIPSQIVPLTTLWVGLALYGGAGWAVLWFGYRETGRRGRLALALFALDLPVFCWVIYLTGGPASYLLPILLVRAADQAHFSAQRALTFVHGIVVSYLGLLVVCQMRGLTVTWGVESFKVLILYLCGLYIAQTAATSRQLRVDLVNAVRAAKEATDALSFKNVQLERTKWELEKASEVRDTFLKTASHELRTPLNGILGFCDLLLMDITPEKRERCVVRATLERALNKISDTGGNSPSLEILGDNRHWASGAPFNLELLLCHVLSDAFEMAGTQGHVSVGFRSPPETGEVVLTFMASSAEGQGRTGARNFHTMMAQTLAESQGGTLEVTSGERDRQIFVLRLPAAPMSSAGF